MRQFSRNTFVCFIDISGFKSALRREINSAGYMLDTFYSAGYNALKDFPSLNGIFVSDCGIIYSDKGSVQSKIQDLLNFVKIVNREMLQENFLTTTSIAYGYLEYKKKFVFRRINKNAILGSGYLNAFLDNEIVNPKLKPGEARITKNLSDVTPQNIFEKLHYNETLPSFLTESQSHYHYNWISENQNQVISRIYSNFENDDSDNKYQTLISNLKEIAFPN